MSVSRQMSFLLISRSFLSELLQYNFLPLGPAAFGFCQGRSVLGSLPEITNKLATDTPNGVKIVLNHRASRHLSIGCQKLALGGYFCILEVPGLLALRSFHINMYNRPPIRGVKDLRENTKQQDALPNSEVVPAEIFVEAGPVVSAEASPLSLS
ncbi:hypothetical protein V6N12_069218 [Hibiscus sabdariffa]|uniref:Uncharacterized protein n=1 Tax=Hibiscus sabdariffa TaxID=183260 RepID=A0ABR2FDN5_9ROSI